MNIKKIAKKSRLLSSTGYFVRDYIYKRNLKSYMRFPVEKNQILFNNFNGKGYADNPRAIAEKLHEAKPDLKLLWTCANVAATDSLPDYITPVKFESDEYYKALATSAVWVFNVLMPNGVLKRQGQCYIQTWHGDRAIKKILYDADADNKKFKKIWAGKLVEPDICDYFVAGSEFAIRMIKSAFGYHGKVIAEGCPRNDCLLKKDDIKIQSIKNSLNIINQKILLYAPTFRDHVGSGEIITSEIQLKKIIEILEQRDNTPWICLMRAHSGSLIKIRGIGEKEEKFIDVTSYSDIADLMLISDMIISDYSSSATDFVLTGKAVLLYQDDYELYTNKDRALYFEMENSPFWVARNMNEAEKILFSITEEAAKENDKSILQFYGACETGKASEKVCSVILEHIN